MNNFSVNHTDSTVTRISNHNEQLLREAINENVIALSLEKIEQEFIGYVKEEVVDYYQSSGWSSLQFKKFLVMCCAPFLMFKLSSSLVSIFIFDDDRGRVGKINDLTSSINDSMTYFFIGTVILMVLAFVISHFGEKEPVYKAVDKLNETNVEKFNNLYYVKEKNIIFDKETGVIAQANYNGVKTLLTQQSPFSDQLNNDEYDIYVKKITSIYYKKQYFNDGSVSNLLEQIVLKSIELIKNMRNDEKDRILGIRFLDKYLALINSAIDKFPFDNQSQEVISVTENTFNALLDGFSKIEALMLENDSEDYLVELKIINK